MATKDYVKRGRSPKKPTQKKNYQDKKSSQMPWKAGAVALLLMGVFGYGLFFLSNEPAPEPVQPVEITPVIVPEKPKKTDPLPPLPEEKWEYMKELPDKEIKVEAKEQKAPEIPYIMQCGAYKTRAQAEERKMDIAFQGLSSEIRKKANSSWYRVVLGPYPYKRQAEKDRHKLQRAKIEPCAIWKDS